MQKTRFPVIPAVLFFLIVFGVSAVLPSKFDDTSPDASRRPGRDTRDVNLTAISKDRLAIVKYGYDPGLREQHETVNRSQHNWKRTLKAVPIGARVWVEIIQDDEGTSSRLGCGVSRRGHVGVHKLEDNVKSIRCELVVT